MYRLGKAESPVVDRTLRKKKTQQMAKTALSWGFLNLILAVAFCFELSYGSVGNYFSLVGPFFWWTKFVLAVLFTLNTAVNVLQYVSSRLSARNIELTDQQRKLLGVKDSDTGFQTLSRHSSPSNSPGLFSTSLTSHSSFTSSSTPVGSLHYSHRSSIHMTPSPSGLRHTPSPSPPHRQSSIDRFNTSGSFVNQSSSFIGSPYINKSHSMGSSAHSSFSRSLSVTGSPLTPTSTLSPLFNDSLDTSGLRSRVQNVSARTSPLRPDECLTDQRSLNQFFKEQGEKEFRTQLGSPDINSGAGSSFWNYNRSVIDYTPNFKKFQYQVACRSPQSTRSPDNDPDNPSTYRGDEVWSKLGIHRDEVDVWVENLRKWLSRTILMRLVKEMNKINNCLARIGLEDMCIGDVSIGTLKQLAVTKSLHVPTLNAVIPFLEVSSNQEYLVKRIRELGDGGCISDFDWNGGGDFKGKKWGEHLPTDAVIVMHMLCTYFDSRLPPHPKYPDGKTFTSQHFIKTPDKPNLKKKENLLIYQTKINPPHYKVIVEDDTWDLPKGRNNMFHAVLLFLHHIRVKEHGMLGRVNLGLSGINILWVLDQQI